MCSYSDTLYMFHIYDKISLVDKFNQTGPDFQVMKIKRKQSFNHINLLAVDEGHFTLVVTFYRKLYRKQVVNQKKEKEKKRIS